MGDTVKCSECGNFCLENEDAGQLQPASRSRRFDGEPSTPEFRQCNAMRPFCAAGVVEFSTNESEEKEQREAERECESFVDWEEGLELKDYGEMKMLLQMRQEDRQRQDEFEARIERRHRTTLIVQFLLALVAAVVALVAAQVLPFFNMGQ